MISAQVATPARLDALRDRVPWAPGAALLVDGAPDAKGYTPFTLPDEQRRHLETVLCRGSAWGRGYPPGMAPEGSDSDDSDGDFDEGDTSDEESLLGLFVDQGVS